MTVKNFNFNAKFGDDPQILYRALWKANESQVVRSDASVVGRSSGPITVAVNSCFFLKNLFLRATFWSTNWKKKTKTTTVFHFSMRVKGSTCWPEEEKMAWKWIWNYNTIYQSIDLLTSKSLSTLSRSVKLFCVWRKGSFGGREADEQKRNGVW